MGSRRRAALAGVREREAGLGRDGDLWMKHHNIA